MLCYVMLCLSCYAGFIIKLDLIIQWTIKVTLSYFNYNYQLIRGLKNDGSIFQLLVTKKST